MHTPLEYWESRMDGHKFSYFYILFGGLKDKNGTKLRPLSKMDEHLFRKTKLANIWAQKNFPKHRFSKTLKPNISTRNLSSLFGSFFPFKNNITK